MTKVFLHVGMPKCASTSLQAHFYQNYDAYRDLGLLYPRVGCESYGYKSHRPLHRAVSEDNKRMLDEIAVEADKSACHTILISSEELSDRLFDQEDTKTLVNNLNSQFGRENVNLLFFFRNHFEFIESAFAQFLKGGLLRVRESDFFRRTPLGLAGFSDCFHQDNGFEFFSFSDFIERFGEGSFENRVHALSIHKDDCGGKGILNSTCNLLGVPSFSADEILNIRLSEKALFFFLHARKQHGFRKFKSRRQFIRQVFDNDQKFQSPIFRFDAEFFERVKNVAAMDKAFFEKRFKVTYDAMFKVPSSINFSQNGPRIPEDREIELIAKIVLPDQMTKSLANQFKNEIYSNSTLSVAYRKLKQLIRKEV